MNAFLPFSPVVRNTEKVHTVLISSMQMYVSVRSSAKLEGLLDAQRGRNCTQEMLVSSIQELKRIILLTSNSQVDLDELARIKRQLQTVFSCISDSISALQSTGKHSNESHGCYGMNLLQWVARGHWKRSAVSTRL